MSISLNLTPARSVGVGQTDVLLRQAYAAYDGGRAYECRQLVSAALARRPRHACDLNNLAVLHLLQGDHASAAGFAEQAMAADPQLPAALVNAAVVACRTRGGQAATALLERALLLAPESHEANANLAYLLTVQRNFAAADVLLQRAEAARPLDWNASLQRIRNALTVGGERTQIRAMMDEAMRRWLAAVQAEIHGALYESVDVPPADTAAALADLDQVFTRARLPFLLFAGTCLGLVRDGAPLANDKDIDIAMLPGVAPEQVRAAVAGHPRLQLVAYAGDEHLDDSDRRAVVLLHSSGLAVDVLLGRAAGEFMEFGFNHPCGDIVSRIRALTPGSLHWNGREWPVPAAPERMLEDLYGPGWQQPDPHFHTVLSNPNRTPETMALGVTIGLGSMLDALQRGDWRKAGSLCTQVLQREPSALVQRVGERIAQRLDATA